MTVIESPVTIEPKLDKDDRLTHLSCCDEVGLFKVLCGSPVTEQVFGAVEADCVVCVELDEGGYCPKYGKCPV
jgi:hypothetical protein